MKTVYLAILISTAAFAQSADLKLKDLSTNDNTAIYVEKNRDANFTHDPEYQIVDGHEEIVGDPENETNAARKHWKEACNEWKSSMKDLNKDNSILTLSCGTPVSEKDKYNISFKSTGSYKLKVRIRDPRPGAAADKPAPKKH